MGLHVRVSSEIPMAAGLGSSAAAAIAGFRLYEAGRAVPLDADDILAMATELEGHPDNAAAALLGGITVSCQTDDGRVIARAWRWPDAIRFVIATPESVLETKHARAALPASIPLSDAVAQPAARAAAPARPRDRRLRRHSRGREGSLAPAAARARSCPASPRRWPSTIRRCSASA